MNTQNNNKERYSMYYTNPDSQILFPYPTITFNNENREVLRITRDGRLVCGEGLSTEKATQEAAKMLIVSFDEQIQEMVDARVASIKRRHRSWCCQKCGNNIGWIGRFVFPFFHKCKEASK
jgi:hypothetical protein